MADEGRQIIFNMVKVGKTLPSGKKILNDIYLGFYYGAKIGILGLNGSGKSTLMRIIAGKEKSFDGDVHFSPGYTIGHLEQEPELDEIEDRDRHREGGREAHHRPARRVRGGEQQVQRRGDDERSGQDGEAHRPSGRAAGQDRSEPTPGTSTRSWRWPWTRCAARMAIRRSRCSAVASAVAWRSAACCLQNPDILLLDEPTNHLDAESVAWLELHLQQYKGTVIAITHDRYFLDNVAGWILELDRGEGIPYKGNYTNWLEQKTARMAQEEKTESKRAAHPEAGTGMGAQQRPARAA